jgi:hypothetical protein
MNEIAIKQSIGVGDKPSTATTRRRRKKDSSFWGYTSLIVLISGGWLLRDNQWINPQDGAGYWLGIAGGSMMLALLIYPLRKRIRILNYLGPTKYWFRMHMVLGLAGPLLILYHCNFQLGSFNSQVAFYCMLLVAGSGIIGRHFYARIHRGLYGQKTSLRELQGELTESVEKSHGLARLMPELIERLDNLSSELQGDQVTQSLGIGRSLRWTFTHHFVRLSLLSTARRELQLAAASSAVVARDYKRIRRTAASFIRDYTGLMGRVAQFSFYERLFALWHVFHLPIFFMMVISAVFHVLAVHMY